MGGSRESSSLGHTDCRNSTALQVREIAGTRILRKRISALWGKECGGMSPLALRCVKQDLAKEATRQELCPRSGPGAPWFKASVCQRMKNGRSREGRGLAKVKHTDRTRGEEGNHRAWPASPHLPPSFCRDSSTC